MLFKSLFPLLAALSAAMLFPSNAWSQVVQDQANSNDQTITNDNALGNTGVVNQTAVYNLGESATYGFRGIVCPRPSVVISGSGNGNSFDGNSSTSYAVSGAVIFPLGGQVGDNCREFTTTLLEREKAELEEFKIKSAGEIIQLCAQLISSGIRVTPEEYPLIAPKCSAVVLTKGRSPRPENIPSPNSTPQEVPDQTNDNSMSNNELLPTNPPDKVGSVQDLVGGTTNSNLMN